MKKLFLLDAYALIYRAYYAFMKNPRINSKGLNTSAIFGFVNSLEDVLKRENPEHIAVAFDPAGKTFRHEAFEQYKAQRLKTPEDIKIAVPYIKQIIENYGITIFQVEGYEADDVIGTLAKKAAGEGFEVFMMTPDKDYAQLVDNHIFQYKPRFGAAGFDTLGVEEIKQKYELETPMQMVDYLGLAGDSSDNIPGCTGVGEKTAIKLLKDFHSIENLLKNTDKLAGALKTKIEENREQVIFSKFLATIKTDVPVDFSEEKVERKTPNFEKITQIFNELEFKTLLNRFTQNNYVEAGSIAPITNRSEQRNFQASLFDDDTPTPAGANLQLVPEKSTSPAGASLQLVPETHAIAGHTSTSLSNQARNDINTTEHQYFLVDTDEKIDDLVKKLMQQEEFCFDTETTSLNAIEAEIVGLSFAFEKNKAYYVPLPENKILAKEIVDKFKQVFENQNISKVGQNVKYDIMMLQNYGVEVKGKMFDTMIAHYLLQPELRHNMDYMAEIFLNYKTIHFDELF